MDDRLMRQRLGFHRLTDYTVRFEMLRKSETEVEYIARVDTDKTDHNGIGATPAEALMNAAVHWLQHTEPTT